MMLKEKTTFGVAWYKNGFRPIYQKPREIKRGRNKGKIEVVVRLYCGENGFRKRIIDVSHLRNVSFA
jgi:hypothetical protein